MSENFDNKISNKIDQPSGLISDPKSQQLFNINTLIDIYEQMNKQAFNISEKIFDHLINVSDADLYLGKIPYVDRNISNAGINIYLRILNDLFPLSCRNGIKIIKRETIEYLSKRTFALGMCSDGGASLDILCQIVNEENSVRLPSQSINSIKSYKKINTNNNFIS